MSGLSMDQFDLYSHHVQHIVGLNTIFFHRFVCNECIQRKLFGKQDFIREGERKRQKERNKKCNYLNISTTQGDLEFIKKN